MLSPHLDDGVFGCGQLLAAHPGSYIVTLFAGRPSPAFHAKRVTDWDRDAGFELGEDVVAARRAEDAAAAEALDATPIWLELLDAQYGGADSIDRCTDALLTALAPLDVAAMFMPLGLFHSDHVRAREAALGVRLRGLAEARIPLGLPWFVYADAIYRDIPDLVERTLKELRARGRELDDVRFQEMGDPELKKRAVSCYPTQLRALDAGSHLGTRGIFTEERYWKLVV